MRTYGSRGDVEPIADHEVVVGGGGPTGLMLAGEYRTARILAGWAAELDVPIYRGREVTGIAQDDTGVDVELSGGQSLRAEYLVGCDAGRSLIRKSTGIDFPGWDPSTSCLIAEVEMAEEPEWGLHRDGGGVHSFFELEDGGPVRVLITEPQVGQTDEPTLRDLSEALIAVYGTDYGMHSATWISRFTDVTRQAASYRDRRVLLAGDAAHVHFPVGGQALDTRSLPGCCAIPWPKPRSSAQASVSRRCATPCPSG